MTKIIRQQPCFTSAITSCDYCIRGHSIRVWSTTTNRTNTNRSVSAAAAMLAETVDWAYQSSGADHNKTHFSTNVRQQTGRKILWILIRDFRMADIEFSAHTHKHQGPTTLIRAKPEYFLALHGCVLVLVTDIYARAHKFAIDYIII